MFNKKWKSILLGVLIFSISLTFSQNIVKAAGTTGWKSSGNAWYYYVNGTMKANTWAQDSSKQWYYLGSNGVMKTNSWIQDSSKQWYYLGSNGAMKTGWLNSGGKWYYLKSSGAMAGSQWVISGGKYYYLNASGDMAVNTITPDNYYVGADGAWDGKAASSGSSDSGSFNVISIE